MKVSKKRLKQMGLCYEKQFRILQQLVKLWEAYIPDNKHKKYLIIQDKDVRSIINRSSGTLERHLKIFEQMGYVDFVALKQGRRSHKIPELCVTVLEKAKQAVRQENKIQDKIRKKNNQIKPEIEDFSY